MAANADPPVPVAQSVTRETDAYEWYQSYLASQSRDPNKRHRRGLLIRDETSDDLLLEAVAWAQLWRDSCSCDRPNPVFIKSALLALEASASAWGKSRPDAPRRREWSVLARYLRLHAGRLHRGKIPVPPKYGSLDAPTSAARRAARMLANDRFLDGELALVVALHGLASLDRKEIEACRFDLATFDKRAIGALLSERVGKSYEDRLTRAGVRLAKGNRGRPRKGLDDSSAGNEPAGAALQNAWRKSGD